MPSPIPGPYADPIPRSDEDLAAFAQNFANWWTPASFSVLLPSNAAVLAAYVLFRDELALATAPETRTPPRIASKNQARFSLVQILRGCIRSAQAAFLAGVVTESELLTLGVRPNSLVRSPVPAPVFAPLLSLDFASVGVACLRVTQVDQATGQSVSTRRFSYGIIGVQLERRVGAGAFASAGLHMRVRIVDDVSALAVGSLVEYRCRYQTGRGLVSPYSPTVAAAVFS